MKANGRDEAWKIADRIFPTDYQKDDAASERAGYPIYEPTSTDEKFAGFHISDLNTRLELNMGKETVTIWMEEKTNFEDLLKVVTEKRRSAEIEERQKYNYYCSRTNNAWNWTKEPMQKLWKISAATILGPVWKAYALTCGRYPEDFLPAVFPAVYPTPLIFPAVPSAEVFLQPVRKAAVPRMTCLSAEVVS